MKAVLSVAGGVLVFTVAILLGFFFSGQSGGAPEVQAYFNTPGQVFDNNQVQSCLPSSIKLVCVILRGIRRAEGNHVPRIYVAMAQFLSSKDPDGDKLGMEARSDLLNVLKNYKGQVWVRAGNDNTLVPHGQKVSEYLDPQIPKERFCSGEAVNGSGHKVPNSKMHHKFLILGDTVITGSLNWNVSSLEDSNENIVVIRNQALADSYWQQFQSIWKGCQGQLPKEEER